MSIMGLIDQSKQSPPMGGIDAPATDMSDVFSTSIEATARNYLSNSKHFFQNQEFDARDEAYTKATGRNIYDDAAALINDDGARETYLRTQKTSIFKGDSKRQDIVDQYLSKMSAEDPDKYGTIMNSQGVTGVVKDKARQSIEAQSKATAGATGAASVVGQLGGGLVAGFMDPVNVATIPLGAGMAAGVIKTALMEAGANVVGEVISTPWIKKWQNELGQEYGMSEFAESAGMAALFGGVMGAGTAIGAKILDKMSITNSAKLSQMRQIAQDIDAGEIKLETTHMQQPTDELLQGLRHEERRLHIQESDLAQISPEIHGEVHGRATEEIDAALAEGRNLDPQKIEITDEQFREAAKMKGAREDFEMILDNAKDISAKATPLEPKEVHPFLRNDPPPEVPTPERLDELQQHYESPEVIAQEKMDFEQAYKDVDPDTIIRGEDKDMSVEEMRDMFKDDESFLSAISSCGLGGGKE